MTEEKYWELIKEIDKQSIRSKGELAKEYAFSKNIVNVGDIIEDHIGKIRVEKIKFSAGSVSFSTAPQCVYYGIELLKSGKVNAKGKTRNVWQTNLLRAKATQ